MNLQREWSKLFIFLFVLLTQRNDLFSPHTEHIFLPRKDNKKKYTCSLGYQSYIKSHITKSNTYRKMASGLVYQTGHEQKLIHK